MKSNKQKPTSPGLRSATKRDFSSLTTKHVHKSLTSPLKKSGGRNNQGRITVRHIGGGHKRKLRIIDFQRVTDGQAMVQSIEYDPNRSSFIALIQHDDGQKSYILASKDMRVGMKVTAATKTMISNGNSMELQAIPTGIAIHNIELDPGRGAVLVRSAGLSATILAHEERFAVVKLPSGELHRINNKARATIGEVSNATHENVVYGKAGRKRWLGIRPTVRGKAMNPNTHPHGGGEGVTSIGLRKGPKTPWGAPALGHPTRDRNKPSSRFIIRKRDK